MLIKEIFETYCRNNFPQLYPCGIDSFDFTNTLYDLYLIPAVYHYHKDRQKVSFNKYLPNFLRDYSTDTNSHRLLSAHLKLLQRKMCYWKKTTDLDAFEGLGDMHEAVYKIKSGEKVLYENVLDIESFLSKLSNLLSWAQDFLPKFTINGRFISRDYIQSNKASVDPTSYYYNFGKIMAFCLYFRVIDIHMENVLATNSSPFMFDVEFMLTPDIAYFPFDIKITGLLSGQTTDNNTALLGGLYDIKSYLKPVLTEKDPFNPKIEWVVKSKGKWGDLPLKKEHPYIFVDQIIKGYREATKDLIARTPEISTLIGSSNFKTRILARTTRLYRFTNLSYTFPQIKTKDPKKYFYNKLCQNHTSGFFKPNKKELINYESEQLCKFAIPYFTAEIRSNEVRASDESIVGKMTETPYDNWIFHAKIFPSFASKQEKQIARIVKNNYRKFQNLNKSL